MKLSELFSIDPHLIGDKRIDHIVTNLCVDSRSLVKGSVFIAIRGNRFDSHQFLPSVCLDPHCIAVVVEDKTGIPVDYSGVVVCVKNTRLEWAILSCRFWGEPSKNMHCVGITGTNGKTTVSYMVEFIFRRYGLRTGVIGTIDQHFEEKVWKTNLTTPDPMSLQKRLSEFRDLGAEALVMEVSSHALDQYRVDGIEFDTVAFTNLSQDHLDYHLNLEDYFAVKSRLFTDFVLQSQKPKITTIVNRDDFFGKKIVPAKKARQWSCGKSGDFSYVLISEEFTETHFKVNTPEGSGEIRLSFPGEFNVQNAVLALSIAQSAGIPLGVSIEALNSFTGVKGRLERVLVDKKSIDVFVDFAHTPDGLKKVLSLFRNLKDKNKRQGNIICVFGCGGNRDKGKRKDMGHIASQYSDQVWVTSDNPRDEEPLSIINEIISGLSKKDLDSFVHIEVDRKKAIESALDSSDQGDVVLIVGKGHENTQEIKKVKISFSDVDVVKGWDRYVS